MLRRNRNFSVIIPDTNSTHLKEILDALLNQTVEIGDNQIIVVGMSLEIDAPKRSQIRFIETNLENCFASDKRNIGIKEAEGEIFLFLDDDCIPRKDWIERHLNRHSLGESVVGGAVEFGQQNYWQVADNLSAFHELAPYTSEGYRPYLAAANLSVHRSVVENAGEMVAHQNRADDLEWTVRFRTYGYQLYFDPLAVIYHTPERRTLASLSRHWIEDAPYTLQVRNRYAGLLNTHRLAKCRPMFLWGSPLIAIWATMRVFSHPRSRRMYWHTLPVVYWTKLVWCWSAYRNFPHGRI